MAWKMIWPVLIVAGSNILYNICQKSTPADANTFAALTATYLIAAILSAILFVSSVGDGNVAQEVRKLNWTSVALGFSIIGLEAGYIFLYRAGWKVSVGSVVCNIVLAVALIFVGVLLYKESVTLRQVIGIAVCAAGLFLISN